MKVEVSFVNFHASEPIRELVIERIKQHIVKFNRDAASARAIFSINGSKQNVKLIVIYDSTKITVTGSSPDFGHSLDKAIDKLDSVMRRTLAKQKHHRVEPKHVSMTNLFQNKRKKNLYQEYNVFDRFEKEYIDDFEQAIEQAI